MKENDGHGARRKLGRKLVTVLTVFLILIGFLYSIDRRYETMSGGTDGFRQSLYNKLRQRHHRKSGQQIETRPEYMRILSAELTLVDIEIVRRELQQSASKVAYAGVYGIFCIVNFGVHKRDPSAGTYRSKINIGSHTVEALECNYLTLIILSDSSFIPSSHVP
jgi:hypothetical protein